MAGDQYGKNRRNDRYGKGDKFDKRDRAGYGRNDDFGSRRHNAGRDFERSDSRDFERPRKPRRNERSHEDYGFSYDERSHDGRRQSMRNTVRAKAVSASIARTRTASYATSVQKVPSVTNAA